LAAGDLVYKIARKDLAKLLILGGENKDLLLFFLVSNK
jgi:hypothetical protein